MGNYWIQVGISQIIIFAILFFIIHTCILSIRWCKNPKKGFGYSNHWFLLCSFILSLFVYYETVTKTAFAPRFYYTWQTGQTDLSQENINGIRLFQNMKDPTFQETYEKNMITIDNAIYGQYVLSNGITIATGKGDSKIIGIVMGGNIDSSIKTQKGITLGDSIEKVKQIYGNQYYSRLDEGPYVIGYVDENKTLEFWYGRDKVFSIRYELVTMR